MKGLAILRAQTDAPRANVVVQRNAEQRVNAIGNGRAVATFAAMPIARHNIEDAAREGYLDGLSDRGFSRHYDDAPLPWQRNYEIGRLWAIGIKVCGIEAPGWPRDHQQQPEALTAAITETGRRIGALRPEIEGIKAPSDNLPVLHQPLKFRRGRFVGRDML